MASDDVTAEPFDADGWDVEAVVGSALGSEVPFLPQAPNAAAATNTTAAAVALTEVFIHCPCVVVRRLREEAASGCDWPAAVFPS